MTVLVNGEERAVADEAVLAHVVAELAPAAGKGVAVAVNGAVVPRGAWSQTRLSAGDRVEVLVATQGG
jgi:sulfur carrier protein